jgi:hypothetical protein
MRFFSLICIMGLNFVLPYSIMLAFAFLLVILDIFLCFLLVLYKRVIRLQDAYNLFIVILAK